MLQLSSILHSTSRSHLSLKKRVGKGEHMIFLCARLYIWTGSVICFEVKDRKVKNRERDSIVLSECYKSYLFIYLYSFHFDVVLARLHGW